MNVQKWAPVIKGIGLRLYFNWVHEVGLTNGGKPICHRLSWLGVLG